MSQNLLASAMLLTVALPLAAQEHELLRVPTREVEIRLPGVAVIRDSEAWEVLWRRFERIAWRDGELVRHDIPRVDFDRDMLIAVGIGSLSGCSNEAQLISRVSEHQESIVVEIGTDQTGPRLTCMSEINPIDVVRLTRSEKSIVFRSLWRYRDVPEPAPWWDWPNRRQLEAMEPRVRDTYLLALSREPHLTRADVRELAYWINTERRAHGYFAALYLIENPLAREDPVALVELAGLPQIEPRVRGLLFERHGMDLAFDGQASQDGLRLLMNELAARRGEHDLASALLANPTVRNDQDLLELLIRSTRGYPDVREEACEVYTARWELQRQHYDGDGNLWTRIIPCPRQR